jgi:hypothetical protein
MAPRTERGLSANRPGVKQESSISPETSLSREKLAPVKREPTVYRPSAVTPEVAGSSPVAPVRSGPLRAALWGITGARGPSLYGGLRSGVTILSVRRSRSSAFRICLGQAQHVTRIPDQARCVRCELVLLLVRQCLLGEHARSSSESRREFGAGAGDCISYRLQSPMPPERDPPQRALGLRHRSPQCPPQDSNLRPAA